MALPVAMVTVIISLYVCEAEAMEQDQVYTECGGKVNGDHGVIQSPNFPGPFPTPIYCKWIISAPSDKKIIIYMTQFYLRGSLDVYEYDNYAQISSNSQGYKLTAVNSTTSYIVSFKPFLVLRFAVHDIDKIHTWVLDYVVDVFGFNITYKLAGLDDQVENGCSIHYCSYLGNCYASSDYSTYKCHCFAGYFGERCQHGPHCDPPEVNLCLNGGTCSYYLGSQVLNCHCPEGYSGHGCRYPPVSVRHAHCISLGCSQRCEAVEDATGNGTCRGRKFTEHNKTICGYCTCDMDYRLADDDKSCLHIDKYRVTVTIFPTIESMRQNSKIESMAVMDATTTKSLPEYSMEETISTKSLPEYSEIESMTVLTTKSLTDYSDVNLKRSVMNILSEVGITTVERFQSLRKSNSSSVSEYQFSFYIESSDMRYLNAGIRKIMASKRLGLIHLTSTPPEYKAEPELYLESLSTSSGAVGFEVAVEGNILTLSCAARGSEKMTFEWFKDGYVINTTLTNREIYYRAVRSRPEEMTRSILSLDNVTPYDKGTFKCRVTDYGESQTKLIRVELVTMPYVDINPSILTVNYGDQVSLICISPDGHQYEWFENNVQIKPGHRKDRIIEVLIPSGARLFIPGLIQSQNFTCRVRNKAGYANATSHIFVPEVNETNLECPKDAFMHVKWRKTVGRHFDRQICPSGAGYATRTCKCPPEADDCHWMEPNFARCQSVRIVQIYDELRILTLGYLHTTMKIVYNHLEEFIERNTGLLYTGEYELATSILERFLDHLNHFRVLANNNDFNIESILNLMNSLLAGTLAATTEETRILKAGSKFLWMANSISTGLADILNISSDQHISLDFIEMNNTRAYTTKEKKGFPNYSNVHLTHQKRHTTYGESINETMEIIHFTYRNITSLLAARSINTVIYSDYISHIISVYPFQSKHSDGIVYMDILVPHIIEIKKKDINETLCLVWKFDIIETSKGGWYKDICTVTEFENTFTVCRCPIPGHFVVAIIPSDYHDFIEISSEVLEFNIMIGCIIMICGIFATFIVFLFNWRKSKCYEYFIQLNFLLALLGINIIFLTCLKKPHTEVSCIVGQLFVTFLFLAAEAFVVIEALHILICATKRFPKYRLLKYMGIGWGSPAVITIIILVATIVTENNTQYTKICWISRDQWQFYAYVIPVSIVVMLYLVFVSLTLKTYLKWKEEWRISKKRKIILSTIKSGVVLLFLVALSLSSMSLYNDNQKDQSILLMCIQICMVSFIFVSSIIFDEKVLSKVWKTSAKAKPKVPATPETTNETFPSGSSFRSFMQPGQIVDEAKREETESLNRYHDEVNRKKFTKERKEHLSSLLGSSLSGHHMNDFIDSCRDWDNETSIAGASGTNVDFQPFRSNKWPFVEIKE